MLQRVYFKEVAEYYYSLDFIYDDNEPYGVLHHYPYYEAYPDMDSCRKAIADEGDLQIENITIKKKTLDWFNESFIIEYNGNFEIMGVDAEDMTGGEWDYLLHQSFEGMWFSFPTPFKRGDIVVSDYSPLGREYGEKCVFVLDSLVTWG